MNYEAHYNNLIERAKDRLLEGYSERHHVIPVCMGGTDDAANLVMLSAEEHYVAHQLLVKIYPRNEKLVYAANAMSMNTNGNRPNNKLYGWLKKKRSDIMTGRPMSAEARKNMSIAQKNRPPVGAETRKKRSENAMGNSHNKGRKHTAAARKNMSEGQKGKKHSEEGKRNMSLAAKKRKARKVMYG